MSQELAVNARLPIGIQTQTQSLLNEARMVVILTDEGYADAAEIVNKIKAVAVQLEQDRVLLKAPFLAATRQLDDYFRGPVQVCESAIKIVKSAMLAYDDKKRIEREAREREQAAERKRLEEEVRAKARAEQEAREAAERARLAEETRRREAAEAEARRAREAEEAAQAQARGDQEAAQAAEKRAQLAEAEAAQAKEQARLDREAAIEARRKQLQAERANLAAQEEAAKPIARSEAPVKVSGVSRKTAWRYRIVKPLGIPDSYLIPDEAKIQAAVDRLKDMAQETLGDWIEVYPEEQLAIGRARK